MSSDEQHTGVAATTTTLTPGQSSEGSVPSKAIDMSQVQNESAAPAVLPAQTTHNQTDDHAPREQSSSERPRTPYGPVRTDTTTALAQALAAPAQQPPNPAATVSRTRAQSTAIGPSTESSDPISKEESQSGPRLELTLLLTNGARHPFIIDGHYITKRNVDVQGNDPYNLSVYKLKELILREWREEWEQKPSSPSYIRLISFGKLLDDKSALKDLKFNQNDRNVVHMTIKPQDFIDEDDAKGAKGALSSGRAGSENRSPGCRCVIL